MPALPKVKITNPTNFLKALLSDKEPTAENLEWLAEEISDNVERASEKKEIKWFDRATSKANFDLEALKKKLWNIKVSSSEQPVKLTEAYYNSFLLWFFRTEQRSSKHTATKELELFLDSYEKITSINKSDWKKLEKAYNEDFNRFALQYPDHPLAKYSFKLTRDWKFRILKPKGEGEEVIYHPEFVEEDEGNLTEFTDHQQREEGAESHTKSLDVPNDPTPEVRFDLSDWYKRHKRLVIWWSRGLSVALIITAMITIFSTGDEEDWKKNRNIAYIGNNVFKIQGVQVNDTSEIKILVLPFDVRYSNRDIGKGVIREFADYLQSIKLSNSIPLKLQYNVDFDYLNNLEARQGISISAYLKQLAIEEGVDIVIYGQAEETKDRDSLNLRLKYVFQSPSKILEPDEYQFDFERVSITNPLSTNLKNEIERMIYWQIAKLYYARSDYVKSIFYSNYIIDSLNSNDCKYHELIFLALRSNPFSMSFDSTLLKKMIERTKLNDKSCVFFKNGSKSEKLSYYYFELGQIQQVLYGEIGKAIANFDSSRVWNPKNSSAWFRMTLLQWLSDTVDDGRWISNLNTAIRVANPKEEGPKIADAYTALSLINFADGDYSKAFSNSDCALEYDYNNRTAKVMHVLSLLYTGSYEQAKVEAESALQAYDKSGTLLLDLALGIAEYELNNFKAAQKVFVHKIELLNRKIDLSENYQRSQEFFRFHKSILNLYLAYIEVICSKNCTLHDPFEHREQAYLCAHEARQEYAGLYQSIYYALINVLLEDASYLNIVVDQYYDVKNEFIAPINKPTRDMCLELLYTSYLVNSEAHKRYDSLRYLEMANRDSVEILRICRLYDTTITASKEVQNDLLWEMVQQRSNHLPTLPNLQLRLYFQTHEEQLMLGSRLLTQGNYGEIYKPGDPGWDSIYETWGW